MILLANGQNHPKNVMTETLLEAVRCIRTIRISITVISCLCYVVTWEVLYFRFLPDFMDKYSAYVVEKARASGASDAAVQARAEQLRKYKEQYDDPLFNAAVTFLEPFPIGLAITLISAAASRSESAGNITIAGALLAPETAPFHSANAQCGLGISSPSHFFTFAPPAPRQRNEKWV